MCAYDWNAEDCQQNSQTQLKWAKEPIAKLDLQGTEDLIDFGCGNGKLRIEVETKEK